MNLEQALFAHATLLDVYRPGGAAATVSRVDDKQRRVYVRPGPYGGYLPEDLTASEALKGADGYPRQELTYRWEYLQDGYSITGNIHYRQDADEIRIWSGAHDELLIVSMVRFRQKCWRIDMSDRFVKNGWYRMPFYSPEAVMTFLGQRWGVDFTEATCQCGYH